MKTYNMAIYFNKKAIYELEVETNSVEEAREIVWDNFICVAYADEKPQQEQLDNFEKQTLEEKLFEQLISENITYGAYKSMCDFHGFKPHSYPFNVYMTLGIELPNLKHYNVKSLLLEYDMLLEKYNVEKIWLKSDYGIYVNGEKIDETSYLVVVK